eukprot:TRINITY_DN4217_c1_g3_i1.p2 TRINITY_DN4217_c1_g3~~TRINITY_DN4217_c1_g3_i1.p2  ORF type:complete len:132 (+),score=17.45 TRINITY_DN4217_c1_g3_i1:401-796(+)
MKKLIELTLRERDFLSKIENNPQAKEHEREAARKVLYLAQIPASTGEGQSLETQVLFEKMNKGHASMAKSILFFLGKAYPKVLDYVDLVGIRARLEDIAADLSCYRFKKLEKAVCAAIDCADNILKTEGEQ